MKKLTFWVSSVLVSGLAGSLPATASIVQSISTRDASGVNGLPKIELPLGHTVNLSFIPSGETIRQVRLDDRSRVILSFDSPFCLAGSGSLTCKGSASVIYLRQLSHPIHFSENETASFRSDGATSTLLTVLTTRGSERNIYQFELSLVPASRTAVKTLQIVPDDLALSPVQSLNSTVKQTSSELSRISRGIERAGQKGLINKTGLMWINLQKFQSLTRSGTSVSEAARTASVPIGLLDWLKTLLP